jgi:XapX domain-containing protein
MKIYVVALSAGLAVGVFYGLLTVRSPAPAIVALVGLLGILLGEQLPPLAKRMLGEKPVTVSWMREQCGEHLFGELPTAVSGELRRSETDGRG